MTLGPWDVVRDLFNVQAFRSMSFADKIDMYYNDYQLIPLMVHENYIRSNPAVIRQGNVPPKLQDLEVLKAISRSADSIADSDLLDKSVRTYAFLLVNVLTSSLVPTTGLCYLPTPCFQQ